MDKRSDDWMNPLLPWNAPDRCKLNPAAQNQKMARDFRNSIGRQMCCDILSFAETVKRRGLNVFQSIASLEKDFTLSDGKLVLGSGGMTVGGGMTQSGGTANLNGGEMSVKGDLWQTGGTMNINGGTLNVGGDYLITKGTKNEDGSVAIPSDYVSAYLVMKNEADQVNVSGQFITRSGNNHAERLTAGTMRIGGDYFQSSPSGGYTACHNFECSGSHTVILNGTKPQNVYFDSTSSRFNKLIITQPKSKYTFSREPCWNSFEERPDLAEDTPASEMYFRSVTASGDNIAVMLDCGERENLSAFCVFYNEQGKMISVDIQPTAAGENSLTFVKPSNTAVRAKLVVLDNQQTPQCASKTVELG